MNSLALSGVLCSVLLAAPATLAQAPPSHPPEPPSAPPSVTAPTRSGNRQAAEAPARPAVPGRPDAPARADTGRADKDTEPEQPVVTRHTIGLHGKPFPYTVTTGYMPLKSAAGETQASIFYMAYTADRPDMKAKRPLMFSFNGGPGSSSVWLHLGAIGPRRVDLRDDGQMPPPPFRLVDNESTWLDRTDVVFIDPVGTGYSHAAKPEDNRKYWGVREDIDSVGEFIRLYLARNGRWDSPLFLVGESYGTFRAAGLAGSLIDQGIALNGILLLSTTLNMGRLQPGSDDTVYPLLLPTYAATAWYHKRMPPDLQQRPLADVLAEVEAWASGDYTRILARGDQLTPEERRTAVDRLARYTGLKPDLIDNLDLRVGSDRFFKEFPRDERRVLGRYDTRFTGADTERASSRAPYDPSFAAVNPVFTMTFNNYVRDDLGFKTDREYGILSSVWPWDFGQGSQGQQGPPDITDALRSALAQNPYMRVFVAEGFYDMATPYYTVEYTLDHMGLTPAMRSRITTSRYEAGHMMYIDTPSRHKLTQDVDAFLTAALAPNLAPESIRVGR